MKYSSGAILYAVTQLLLLDYCMTKLRRKPTNSVTVRQSAGDMCTNSMVGDFVEHATECSMFYLCVEDGDAILATCPPTMLFNTVSKLCDLAANVDCDKESSEDISAEDPIDTDIDNMVTDAASYCARFPTRQSNNRIIYIGSSSSCSQYYVCYYGKAVLQECSPKLHWNAVTGKCDTPERAHCTLNMPEARPTARPPVRPTSSGISITGVNELVDCPLYGEHLYPHMQRCELFIYCVKGQAILQQCPFYYHFDVVSKSCQWSRTAMCVRNLNLSGKLLS